MNLQNKKCVMAILENHTDIYANMYPFEQVKQDLSGVKELSLQNHPGCMIGMNISGRILNHNVLRNLGIGDRDRKETLIQNLQDAGCNQKIIDEFLDLLDKKQTDKIFILLSKYRSSLLESLHKNQKEIDILDYLIVDLKKKNF